MDGMMDTASDLKCKGIGCPKKQFSVLFWTSGTFLWDSGAFLGHPIYPKDLTKRQTDKKTDRQTKRQTNRQTDRQTDRQADRDRKDRPTGFQTANLTSGYFYFIF